MNAAQQYYTVEQIAELLDLHVKTVRGYVRDGRLPAARVGRQYRISREDLEAFTGTPVSPASAPRGPRADASSIVQVDGVDRHTADRLANAVTATALGRHGGSGTDAGGRLRVETVFDEERDSLKFVVLGDLDTTAELLKVLDALIGGMR
ncbi:helix-turn-helix domain-containing protein [Streptomyces roseicoloratus]|uniref:Helix-turn-helix domain-containing protein n=1 Tax=Streptomyces roseicoloratus TaxID=2508722 RepID=A0ABY9S3U9_9ACTN|nr:helix-turn-helix domain-containing protein [Streptomyces roseicoloratus]WMX48608.1 helix-turn-helix domain-containing protein [Streptomyces roseicoloratus]